MRIAIIGGGPGGLITAYYLQKRAPGVCKVTLYESSDRLGGKIITRQFSKAPLKFEAGAAELYDYSQLGIDPLKELVVEMGLSTRPMKGRAVVIDNHIIQNSRDITKVFGRKTNKSLRRFLRNARMAISPPEYYESDWKQDNADPYSKHSFRSLLNKVSDPDARRFIEVAVHSDLATEPENTSASYGLQNYLMDEPDYMRLYTIDGGIERLPQELAKRLTAKILLQRTVLQVSGSTNNTYTITSRHKGQITSETYDFVVMALPNNWLMGIQYGGELLQKAMRKHHAHYDYPAHYLRVTVLFKAPFWREQIPGSYFMLDAFGGCCVYDESSRATDSEYGILGWLIAGEQAQSLCNLDDSRLTQLVLENLPECLKHGAGLALESHVHRYAGAVNGMPGGRPIMETVSRHIPEPTRHKGLFVVGDYLFDSTINGCVDSADVVAESIIEEVMKVQNPFMPPIEVPVSSQSPVHSKQ